MNAKSFLQLCVSLTVATGLSGCGMMQSHKSVDEVTKKVLDYKELNLAQATTAAVSRTSKPRIAGEEIILRKKNELPDIFAKQVVYSTHGAQSFSEVLETLGSISGLAVRASEISSAGNTNTASSFTSSMGSQTTGINAKVQLDYRGSLRGLFDDLANRTEASWRYVASSNSIEFFKYETRTLSLYLPSGSKTVDASISLAGVSGGGGGSSGGASGGSGGGSSGGGGATAGNVSVSQTMRINPWNSILNDISAILSEGAENGRTGANGTLGMGSSGMGGSSMGGSGTTQMTATGVSGRASANPELGILTVTARPRAVERIALYIESINSRFAQNVMIDVKIYSVTMDKQASLGFSMDAIYKYLNGNGLSVVGAQPIRTGTGTPGQLTVNIDNPRSRLYGSSIIAQALSQIGNVALQTEGQVATVNGQPAPIQVVNEVNYLATSSTTQTPNVGSTTALTPGSRMVGLTGNFLPVIIGDNRILLQYQLQLSTLTALTTVTSGTSLIQTPQISSQSLQQQAFVKDGQSIVLFGFDQNRATADAALGIGNASTATRSERQMLVIVMQVNGGRKNA